MSAHDSKQAILLEAGTNELEVLIFAVGSTRYGVNVAKVREVIGTVRPVSIPRTHPAVMGVFKLRDSVIPLVDLQLYFQPGVPSTAAQRNVILMEFNGRQVGYVVDRVERIFRLSWSEVQPAPAMPGQQGSVITAVCVADGRLALMVDFEKITFDINGDANVFQAVAAAGEAAQGRGAYRLLLAEDSPTIRRAIRSNLEESGYRQVCEASDGEAAWNRLQTSLQGGGAEPFAAVITDIEMPRMDGLHLCRKVKEHPQMRHLPVIVFSSLVSDTNLKKCAAVGADAAVTKPEMVRVVGLLDRLLAGLPADAATAVPPATVPAIVAPQITVSPSAAPPTAVPTTVVSTTAAPAEPVAVG